VTRSIDNGGATHARYGHRSRARDLDVVCPQCGGRALATQPSASDSGVIVGDLHPAWGLADWTVSCSRCGHGATELSYERLPPLFWMLESGTETVWAWNRDHLAFVAAVLEGQDVRSDPYAWLAAYVPGNWKRDGKRVARTIRKKLSGA